MKKKFLRTDHMRYSKLGKRRKSLLKWRRPKGRDNKMREKRFGYPKSPSVGYKTPSSEAGKLKGKEVIRVNNLKELGRVGKDSKVIVAKVGAKKRIEIIKMALEKKIDIVNLVKERKNEIRK